MTPTNAQIEAVADAIDSALRSNHAMMYEECEAAALAAIAALDIEKIEREAYERVRRILLSRGVSDYLGEVFMEPEYWDSNMMISAENLFTTST